MTESVARLAQSQVARPHAILALDEFGARSRDGRSVAELTVTQFALLHFLAYLSPGKVGTYFEIAAAIRPFDKHPLGRKPIQWHVFHLKRIVSTAEEYRRPDVLPWPREVIRTRKGVGYLLDWTISAIPQS